MWPTCNKAPNVIKQKTYYITKNRIQILEEIFESTVFIDQYFKSCSILSQALL